MYDAFATGPGPTAMSSQSIADAPASAYVPRSRPSVPTANTRAVSPESLCTHHTPSVTRLALMPESSTTAGDATLPGVDDTSVPRHAASSTGGLGGGGGGQPANSTEETPSAATMTATGCSRNVGSTSAIYGMCRQPRQNSLPSGSCMTTKYPASSVTPCTLRAPSPTTRSTSASTCARRSPGESS